MLCSILFTLTLGACPQPTSAHDAVLMLSGIPSADAVAVNPQGAPMVAMSSLGGGVARVVARGSTKLLVETSGRPAGLAFDRAGDLYVTDRQLGALFKVTPWGHLLAWTEGMKAPEGVAVGNAGEVYVVDAGASRVYRVSPDGQRTVLVSDLSGPRGIVMAADGRRMFVSDGATVWQFAPDGTGKRRFAALADRGVPAVMALDEQGRLYVARDGGGKVSVLAEGQAL